MPSSADKRLNSAPEAAKRLPREVFGRAFHCLGNGLFDSVPDIASFRFSIHVQSVLAIFAMSVCAVSVLGGHF